MNYIISILIPILLLAIAHFYSNKIYKRQLHTWYKEITGRSILIYGLYNGIKSIILLYVIVLIHNAYHDQHLLELLLFVIVFIVVSILQSVFSIGGFVTRNKAIIYSSYAVIKRGSSAIGSQFNKFANAFFDRGTLIAKLVITILFIVAFLPNIGLYLTTNTLLFLSIISLLLISLALNHVIYFGFIALLVFQYQPTSIDLNSFNPILMMISYLAILIGLSIDRGLQHTMFMLVTVMPIKKFNFRLGYDLVYQEKSVIIYQNLINQYYYVYFQKIGLVTVYHSDFNLRNATIISKKLITYAKRLLKKSNEFLY